MNATELFLANGKPSTVFYCGQCRTVHRSKELGDQCCQNYICSSCGKDTGSRSYLICDSCREAKRTQDEADKFAKAEKLTQWYGWVYSEGHGYQEGFFPRIAEFRDWYADWDDWDEGPKPEIKYVWACHGFQFVHVEFSDIAEDIEVNAYEDFDPNDLNGVAELKAALEAFNAANVDKIRYEPDYKLAVLL